MLIRYGAFSDIGNYRQSNQDSIYISHNKYSAIGVICDGVGGVENGEIASVEVALHIRRWFKKTDLSNNFETLYQSLYESAIEINSRILKDYNLNETLTSTTVSVLFIHHNRFFILHLGDSRIYKFGSSLFQITKDQIYSETKQINGQLVTKNYLMECVGIKEYPSIFCAQGYLEERDIFILCSDGFYNLLDTDKFEQRLKKITRFTNLNRLCNKLVQSAKRKQEKDNITVGLIRYL